MSVSGVRIAAAWVLAVALCACHREAVRPRRASEALRYTISYVREPEHALDVELVLLQGGPREFLFTQPGGVRDVQVVDEEGRGQELLVRAGQVHVPREARLLRYRYPLATRVRESGPALFTGLGAGDAWHVAGRAYLLRPRTVTPSLRAELVVEGVDALLPWAPGPDGVYRLQGEDLVDSGFHGFGGRRCKVELPGAVLEVALLGQLAQVGDVALCGWLRQAAEEVLTVRRAFPYPRITVRVVPVPGESSPALHGRVLWSSPPSISILVGREAAPESFAQDWVAVHELLHLAHPSFLPRVPWLSEGLATYYTEVARARSGRQTPRRAWEELLAGFERGCVYAEGRTMAAIADGESSPAMYWTGALFALHLDVELRHLTRSRHSLDDVLERLAESGPIATLESFGNAVDALAGQPLFQQLLARHLSQPAFSELKGLLEAQDRSTRAEVTRLKGVRHDLLWEALEGVRSRSTR